MLTVNVTRGNHGPGCGLAEAFRVAKSARMASDNSTLFHSALGEVGYTFYLAPADDDAARGELSDRPNGFDGTDEIESQRVQVSSGARASISSNPNLPSRCCW
jgi:hypothetical protein